VGNHGIKNRALTIFLTNDLTKQSPEQAANLSGLLVNYRRKHLTGEKHNEENLKLT
jgi:hypothetical protein